MAERRNLAPPNSTHLTLPGLQRRHYRLILMDPPWHFSGGAKDRPQHYPRLKDHEMVPMPIRDLAHPDGAWLMMWVTSPKLADAIKLGKGWSFRYSGRAFVWIKTHRKLEARQRALFVHPDSIHRGTGYTTRKNAEDVLLFKVGKPKRRARDVFEVIFAPPRENSRKPDETHERIERFCAGPYCELFARSQRPGWDVWGNQVDLFKHGGEVDGLAA